MRHGNFPNFLYPCTSRADCRHLIRFNGRATASLTAFGSGRDGVLVLRPGLAFSITTNTSPAVRRGTLSRTLYRMGRQGIRRRKPVRHLPPVRGVVDGPTDNPNPLTPVGWIAAYGNIARATNSRDPRVRRRALVLCAVMAAPGMLVMLHLARNL